MSTKKAKPNISASIESSRAGTPSNTGDSNPTSTTKPKEKPPTSAVRQNSDGVETQQCKHCKEFVLRDGFQNHSKQCLREKKERKRQKELRAERAQAEIDAAAAPVASNSVADETRGSTPASKAAGDNDSIAGDKQGMKKQNKKRKAEKDAAEPGDKPPPKKKKTQPTATAVQNTTGGGNGGKPRGPVSVEVQCGVLMPNGIQCARSLTCKSHSMGSKRSVPGRSAPYDVLLAAYQKKNQAKLQRAAIANLKGVDDFEESGAKVDSDEEREAVMAAVARAAPRPLIGIESAMGGVGTGMGSVWSGYSVKARYQHVRMKEMLSNALGGNRGGNLFAVPPRDAQGDAEGDLPSAVTASRRQSMQPPPPLSAGIGGAA